MHPYLPHLLSDISAAHQIKGSLPESGPDNLEDHFREIDRYISGDSEQTLRYYCGLDPAEFPPAEAFSEKEIIQLCHAFEEMLDSWNASVDWPEKIPWDKRYAMTVALLDREFIPMDFGMIVFDFCTGYAPECELGEYCNCLEYWKEEN